MKPIRSNTEKETCSPVSSNCVVWQGPDLCCINLCTGDSISDVTFKLAIELCNIQNTLNLSDLDLKCLFDQCIACPEPEKTLHIVLQLLIDKVCSLEDLIASLSGAGSAAEVTVRVAQCLQQVDANGDYIRDLVPSQYVQVIGQYICNILRPQISVLEGDVNTLQDSVDVLQGQVTGLLAQGDPEATPTCILPAVPTSIVEFSEALEQQFCEIKTAIGTAGEILDVVDAEANCQTPVTKLLDTTMTLWTDQSTNLAQSLNHMWLAICDLRGAVRSILDNCCKISCADIIIDFDVQVSDDNTEMTLFFLPKSNLPNGFHDCNTTLGTTFNIADNAGHLSTFVINLYDEVFTDVDVLQNGYTLSIPGAIDPKTGMTITGDVCITNNDTTCFKCIKVEVAPHTSCCTVTAVEASTIIYKMCS